MKSLQATLVIAVLGLAGTVVWLNWPDSLSEPSLDQPAHLMHPGLPGGNEPVSPLPAIGSFNPDKVKLGESLFFETRLSADNSQSCASCHDFKLGGTDRRPFSVGINNAVGTINAPTVFNVGMNFVQFWDGRAATLEEQVPGPVHNPVEMASSWEQALPKLNADAKYREAFAKVYGDGVTAANVIDAIATYERTLVTPDARFDRYLRGETGALSALEQTGYQRFKDFGCASCHQGVALGANMYQRFGIMADYYADRQVTKTDLGRYNVTGLEEDRHVFKVPGLRNVAVTAPYFHDGSIQSLEEAVMIMARYQLGRDLRPDDVRAITAFLHSLTGMWQGQYLE